MGGPNKMLMDISGRKIIKRVFDELAQASIDHIVLVTGRDQEKVAALFPTGCDVVFNPNFASGLTSSIQTGLHQTNLDHACMMCLGDMVWLQKNHYNTLIEKAQEAFEKDPKAIIIPRVNGKPGNPVIFSGQYRSAILGHKAPNGCKGIVQQNLSHRVFFDTSHSAYLLDIDTPQDLPDKL